MNTYGILKRFGTRSTQLTAIACGRKFPFYYVAEYPRSGGNWLCGMLSDYTGTPFPVSSVLPVGCTSIHHVHWGHSPKLTNTFYLVRDGRDICISMFFYMHRKYQATPKALPRRWQTYFANVSTASTEQITKTLPDFLYLWKRHPWGCRMTWQEHVLQWHDHSPRVTYLRYEDLLTDCFGTLHQSIPKHFDRPIDDTRLSETVRRFNFEALSGRKPGEEDKSSFIRKGIAGDWKNYFNQQIATQFSEFSSEGLEAYGYEENSNWIESLPQ